MSDLEDAAAALARGDLVVMPTDTVYGIAVSLTGDVTRVFEVKGRPDDKPLPVLAASRDDLETVASFGHRAQQLADEHWPGPLTIVLPRAEGFMVYLGEGARDSVAVRVPANETALELLAETGPLAVTSANISGQSPARTVDDARAALGDAVDVYVDAGELAGEPSTIVSLVGDPQVLRNGPLSIHFD